MVFSTDKKVGRLSLRDHVSRSHLPSKCEPLIFGAYHGLKEYNMKSCSAVSITYHKLADREHNPATIDTYVSLLDVLLAFYCKKISPMQTTFQIKFQ